MEARCQQLGDNASRQPNSAILRGRLLKTMGASNEPVEILGRIEVNELRKCMPQICVAALWAGQQQIIDINSQECLLLGEPKGGRVICHRLPMALDNGLV